MKARLLVADRSAAICDVYRLYFEGCGYEVATACDGLECLTKLFDRPPAALVLECGLHWGGADGAVTRMREALHLPPIPVILIDGAGPSDELADLIGDSVVARLRKPFRMHELLDCLTAAERPSTDRPSGACPTGKAV